MGKRSAVFVALVLVALAGLTVPGESQAPIKMGVIEPLSGPVAASGNYVRMGAEIHITDKQRQIAFRQPLPQIGRQQQRLILRVRAKKGSSCVPH